MDPRGSRREESYELQSLASAEVHHCSPACQHLAQQNQAETCRHQALCQGVFLEHHKEGGRAAEPLRCAGAWDCEWLPGVWLIPSLASDTSQNWKGGKVSTSFIWKAGSSPCRGSGTNKSCFDKQVLWSVTDAAAVHWQRAQVKVLNVLLSSLSASSLLLQLL